MLTRTISLTVCCMLFGGCAASLDQNMGKIGGTALGAAGGAALGNKVGGNKGAFIGSIVGGLIGYTIGSEIDKRREELKKIAQDKQMDIYFSDIKSSDIKNNTLVTQESQVNDTVNNGADKVGDKVIITDTNQFNIGSSELSLQAQGSFNKIAKIYAQSNKKILIIGHTDDTGSSSDNQKLSEERAKNLGKIFAENGVKQENIYFLGAGETQPIANNNTVSGAAKNRRVEIVELSNEQEIALYSNFQKTNPSFFRQVEIKSKSKEVAKVAATTAKQKSPEPTVITNKTDALQKISDDNTHTDFIDFGGIKSSNKSLYSLAKFGEAVSQESFIGIGTQAKADIPSNLYGNCIVDKPRVYGETKSLASGEKIEYKTSEYKNGLNQSSWTTFVNSHLVGLAPIGVLRDNSRPISSPNIYIYKSYAQNSNAKPNEVLSTTINTYQGTKGLLYRVFVTNEGASLKCIDIIFDEKNVNLSTGKMYYSTNVGLYEKDFTIQEVGRN